MLEYVYVIAIICYVFSCKMIWQARIVIIVFSIIDLFYFIVYIVFIYVQKRVCTKHISCMKSVAYIRGNKISLILYIFSDVWT